MATYIQGLTGNAPQIQQFKPDHNFYQSVLTLKQNQYDQGLQQVSSLYGSALDVELTRSDNKQKKQEFFNQIEGGIKKLAGLDLSLKQNVEQAYGLFNQFLHDESIQHDAWFTRTSNDELARAEAFRKNCVDPEECGGEWWEGGEQLIQLSLQEYRDAPLHEALTMQPEEFVPAQNVWKIATDIMKEIDPDKTVEYVTASKEFVVKDKNGDIVNGEVSALLTGILGSDPRIKEYYKAQAKLDRLEYVAMNKDKLGSADIANAAYYGKKLQELYSSFNKLIDSSEESEENKGYLDYLKTMRDSLKQTIVETKFLGNLAKAVGGDNTISVNQEVGNIFGEQANESPIQKEIRELFEKQKILSTSLDAVNYLFEEAKRNGQYTQGFGLDIMDSFLGDIMLNWEINSTMVDPLSNIWSIHQTKTAPGNRTRGRIGSSGREIVRTSSFNPETGETSSRTISIPISSGDSSSSSSSSSSGSGNGTNAERYGGSIRKYQKAGEVVVEGNPVEIKFGDIPDIWKFSINNEYEKISTPEPVLNAVKQPRSWEISTPSLDDPLKYWERSENENNLLGLNSGMGVTNGLFQKKIGDMDKYKDDLFREQNGCTKNQFVLAFKHKIIADPIATAQASQKVYNALSTQGYNHAKLFYTTVDDAKACGSGRAGIDYKEGYGYAGVGAIFMNEKNTLFRKITEFESKINEFDQTISDGIHTILTRKYIKKYGADPKISGYQQEFDIEYNNLVDEFHTALRINDIKDIIDYDKKEVESQNNDLPYLHSLADKLDESVNYEFLNKVMSYSLESNTFNDLGQFYNDVFDIAYEIEKSKEFWDAQQVAAKEYIDFYNYSNWMKASSIGQHTMSETSSDVVGFASAAYGAFLGGLSGAKLGKGIWGKVIFGGLGTIAGGVSGYMIGEELLPTVGPNMTPTDASKISLLNNFINFGNACGSNNVELLFSNTPDYRLMAGNDIKTISDLIGDEVLDNDDINNPETSKEVELTPVGIAMMLNSVCYSTEADVNLYSRDILKGYESALEKLNITGDSLDGEFQNSNSKLKCTSIDVYDNKVALVYENPNAEKGSTQRFAIELEKDENGHYSAGRYQLLSATRRPQNIGRVKFLDPDHPELPEEEGNAISNDYDIYTQEGQLVLPPAREKQLNDLLNSKVSVKLNLSALAGVKDDYADMYGSNGPTKESREKRRDYETNTRWLGIFGKNNGTIELEDVDENTSFDSEEISQLWNQMYNFNYQDSNNKYLATTQYETFGRTFTFEYPRGYYDDNSNLKFINIDQDIRSKYFDEFLSKIEEKSNSGNILGFELHNNDIYWPELDGDGKPKDDKYIKDANISSVIKQLRFDGYKNSDNKLLSDRYDVYISPIVNNNQSYIGFTIKDHNGHNLEDIKNDQGHVVDRIWGYTFYLPYDYVKETNLGRLYRDNSLIYMVKFNDGEITFPASKYNTKCVFKRQSDGTWVLANNPYMQNPRIFLFGYATGMDAVYNINIANLNNDYYPDNLSVSTKQNIRTKFESDEDLASYLFYLRQCVDLNNKIYFNMASQKRAKE